MNKHHFSGGIALAGHKHLSPIIESAIPNELIYPLLQRTEHYAIPIVKIGQKVLKGQVIARSESPLAPPIHAASSGKITAIEPRIIAHPSGLSDTCLILSPDDLEESIDYQPCPDYRQAEKIYLLDKIYQAGIMGLGGALFPTALKLQAQQDIHTLIINAAECEPYISCDASLILQSAAQIIQGVAITQYILGAKHCIIALEETMQAEKTALQTALKQINTSDIQLSTVPAIYPTGGEKQLIQVLTGLKIPAAELPQQQGIICQNVGTIYAIQQAIIQGKALTERIITLTGDGIQQAQNIRARIGTPIAELIPYAGGYTPDVQRLIMGGSMMGFALSTDKIAVTKASNCILALSTQRLAQTAPAMACIRCGDCATVCPAELLPQQLYWHNRAQQFEQSQQQGLFDCIECGCCDVVCPSQIPLVQSFRAAKGSLMIQKKQAEQAQHAKMRFQNQQNRKAKAEQEKRVKAEKRQAAIDKMKAAAAARKKVT